MVENLVEISGRSQLYDLEESSPNALKSDKSTNKNGIVNIMCLILLRFYDSIIGLKDKHTLVIVDHSDIFVKLARTIVALGEKSGKNGGYLIDVQNYIKKQNTPMSKPEHTLSSPIKVILNSKIYQYNGVDIELSEGCLNLITGASGIGKSTLIREYFPQFFESYAYVNQRPILGNKNSNMAASLDIATEIFSIFAKKFKKDKNYFSNNTGNEGCCPSCLGAGYIEYGSEKNFCTAT